MIETSNITDSIQSIDTVVSQSKITRIKDPILKRRWPIIFTFFIFCANNSFQMVELTEQEQQQCDQFLNLSLDQDAPEGVSENLSFSFAEAVDASAEVADDSVLSLKAKKKQNNSLRPEIANRSVAEPFIIRDKSLKK